MTRKLLAILLSMCMVISVGGAAFAEGTDGATPDAGAAVVSGAPTVPPADSQGTATTEPNPNPVGTVTPADESALLNSDTSADLSEQKQADLISSDLAKAEKQAKDRNVRGRITAAKLKAAKLVLEIKQLRLQKAKAWLTFKEAKAKNQPGAMIAAYKEILRLRQLITLKIKEMVLLRSAAMKSITAPGQIKKAIKQPPGLKVAKKGLKTLPSKVKSKGKQIQLGKQAGKTKPVQPGAVAPALPPIQTPEPAGTTNGSALTPDQTSGSNPADQPAQQ